MSVEALAVPTTSLRAPGAVQLAISCIRSFQLASPVKARLPAAKALFIPSFQAASNRNRSNVELAAPKLGTLVTVNRKTAEVMVDPEGMLLTSNRSNPRRTPPWPSRPASNQVIPPALLPGLLEVMNVSATTGNVTISAEAGSVANPIAMHTYNNNISIQAFITTYSYEITFHLGPLR